MSIPVELSGLADAMAGYRFAYLMTTSGKGAPHAVAVSVVLDQGLLIVEGIGRRTRENALARPAVGLVWPPESASGYSLIVDGQASVVADQVRIAPTRAVLHRPVQPASSAQSGPPGACGSDCVEIPIAPIA
ncbi:MAG: pyridoxamine 5'-phosphate oxidase family protein [Burkholderiaceae bacterium]